MVAQFLRLRLALAGNLLRREGAQRAGVVFGLLLAVAVILLGIAGLVGLRSMTDEIARAVTIVLGSAIVLGFLLVPLVLGSDDPLDPRRFSLLGIRSAPLAIGLAVAGAATIPILVVTVLGIAQIATWSRGPLPVLFAILGLVLVVPTCVLAARVSSTISSVFLASRRSRESSGLVLLLVIAVAAPGITVLATVHWESQGLPIIRRIASVLGWTPFAAAWSAPGDAAVGDPATGTLKLAIALVFLAVLWGVWRALVSLVLTLPERDRDRRAVHTGRAGLGWFGWLPATPFGAIAARSLTYWARDGRYRVGLAVIPIVPIVMVVALIVGGVPPAVIAWVPVPVMCLFLGWTVHNDTAHDSTAFWVHVSANTRGSDDRWGRVIPALVAGVPLALVGSLVTSAFTGNAGTLPGLIGLSLCVLFAALGISSFTSAAFPYPAVHPGDSPFAQPQAVGTAGSVVQSISFVLTILIASPIVGLIVLAAATSSISAAGTSEGPITSGWYGVALAAGLALGILVLLCGVYAGGRAVSRRAPELLAFTLQN